MEPLISAQTLAELLDEPELIIVDCRFRLQNPNWGRQQYYQNHIPRADYLDLNQDLSAPPNALQGRHPLPPMTQFAQTLCQLGVRQNQTLVVVYDQAQPAFAARLWWLFRYWGHNLVRVLDGGWVAWQAQGYPTTSTIPERKENGQFIPQAQPNWTLECSELKRQIQNQSLTLVDCRDAVRYRGEVEPIDPIAGHIPGAINHPWREACTPEGFLRTPQEIQSQWADIDLAHPTAVYCGSGVTACVNLLALAHAQLPQPQLYPGGWSAWCNHLI
ncbi:MAG: sulfurtransferase [Spirulina sp. SIO3F2]|nr:sulfurtransferase [Spirulina sp. SIO3F2]